MRVVRNMRVRAMVLCSGNMAVVCEEGRDRVRV